MIFSLFKKFQGRHHRKFVDQCRPLVKKICSHEVEYQKLMDNQLRAKTQEFMQRHQAGESLDALLPEAFAAVKNAARRLCGQTLQVCEHDVPWQMVHHDVQLIGGIALHQGNISEMATGEGKTLVATLPLYLNALTGRNVQLVTVNDYLARRDSEWMGHLYETLGLTVGCIQNDMDSDERRLAYGCNITYATASELGFDYLRDNGMARRQEDQVQRDFAYAIVDEVDSVLIDEARTPLIISGPSQDDGGKLFMELRDSVKQLVSAQVSLCNDIAAEVLEKSKSERKEDQQAALEGMFKIKMGMPRNRQFMKLMENGALRRRFEKYQLEMQSDFNKEGLYKIKEELFFEIDEKQRESDLTEKGRKKLCPGDDQAFLLPDLPLIFSQLDKSELSDEQRQAKKQQAEARFAEESARIHALSQLLRAYCLYDRDVEYVVQDGKVMIVDENTGRVMPGRRWSEGLHQAVEAKEGVRIERETKTYATITLQNFFRLYDKLAGMTGTAETEASEFFDIYKLNVRVIPTHKPSRREELNDSIFKTRLGKYKAVIRDITQAHKRGQPVLVGTASVEASEILSRMLRGAKIPHEVLNAKQHEREADIISLAGQKGAVTISTNMAGRGTDIRLAQEVLDKGLLVLGTERHESRRIDRQLQGRCGRQGDIGMAKFYVSLEDDLMRHFAEAGPIARLLEKSFGEDDELEHPMLNRSIAGAQKKVEQLHYLMRRRLLQYDDVLNRQRQIVYALRNEALHSQTPKDLIFDFILEVLEERLGLGPASASSSEAGEGRAGFLTWIHHHFPVALTQENLKDKNDKAVRDIVFEKIKEAYTQRESLEDPVILRQIERYVIVRNIDRHWQTHLTEMEELRRSVSLRGYGQKDPLNEYKSEAFNYFEALMREIRTAIAIEGLRFTSPQAVEGSTFMDLIGRVRQVHPQVTEDGDEVDDTLESLPVHMPQIRIQRAPAPTAGRNDLCPCGSGAKYKKCCGKGGSV